MFQKRPAEHLRHWTLLVHVAQIMSDIKSATTLTDQPSSGTYGDGVTMSIAVGRLVD